MAKHLNKCRFNSIKGSKIVHAKASASRELVTVVACGNAAGTYLPPHVIVPGKTLRALNSYDTQNAPPKTHISVSSTGWMKSGISQLWFEEVFLKVRKRSHLPLLYCVCMIIFNCIHPKCRGCYCWSWFLYFSYKAINSLEQNSS